MPVDHTKHHNGTNGLSASHEVKTSEIDPTAPINKGDHGQILKLTANVDRPLKPTIQNNVCPSIKKFLQEIFSRKNS